MKAFFRIMAIDPADGREIAYDTEAAQDAVIQALFWHGRGFTDIAAITFMETPLGIVARPIIGFAELLREV